MAEWHRHNLVKDSEHDDVDPKYKVVTYKCNRPGCYYTEDRREKK